MTENIQFLANEIDKLWTRFRNYFIELNYEHEDHHEIEENIKYTAEQIFQNGKLFFEYKNLPGHRNDFVTEVAPIISDRKKLMDMKYYDEIGEAFSTLSDVFHKYFSPFSEFNVESNEINEQKYGRQILENILKSTNKILTDNSLIPSHEPDIYPCIRKTVEVVFPEHKTPTTPFLRNASEYKPDVLLPILKSAVEYKLARNEKELNKTMDEILIDVQGYDEHTDYDFFYAAFYVKSGVTTSMKFDLLWKQKKFPKNWKPIFIEGPVA